MALITLKGNIADVATDFVPLPAGQYVGKIVSCELTKSSKGNNMLKFKWEVIDGEFIGRTLFDQAVIVDDMEKNFNLARYAKVIGMEGEEIDTDAFLNAEAILEVTQEPYNDRMTNKIKNITPMNA